MDGNGRWAKKRGLPRLAGHRAGAKNLIKIVEASLDLGFKYLTVYAFSTENWRRPAEEIQDLMKLLIEYVDRELEALKKNSIKIKIIGDPTQLPKLTREKVFQAEEETKNNQRLCLQIALNYGGRKEILDAVNRLSYLIASGEIQPGTINDSLFEKYLYTRGIPEPDLLIRTAGELRLSNFLLWQLAYTEFWFTDLFWPEFHLQHFHQAIYDYQHRQRRFGGFV